MIAFNLSELELMEGWVEGDPTTRARFAFPLTGAQGAASTSVIYFEIPPRHRALRHTHTAEETLLILDGEAEVEVDGETGDGAAGSVVLIPAHAPHGIRNTGDAVLKVVGFFAAAGMVSTYEAPIEPLGVDVLVTPPPEDAIEATGLRGTLGSEAQ